MTIQSAIHEEFATGSDIDISDSPANRAAYDRAGAHPGHWVRRVIDEDLVLGTAIEAVATTSELPIVDPTIEFPVHLDQLIGYQSRVDQHWKGLI